ncbi:thrombospondin type-1 domain-containing protein 7A [Aplysia californica]|uniref:Thrombospondin type-1 domain-containing protein 7A n=1 Tax=Aplysia californica TaxID=6500 RepID=A0ABM1A8F7_APLCA|nr:thrombospondin type-1 domain-containing protein 7A [Aplysia californica]
MEGVTTCARNSGVKSRDVTCELKKSQTRVSSSRCEAEEPTPVASQSCELLCRQDCVVSEFSDWSVCDKTCEMTNRTRTRRVIVPPRHQGSVCPDLSLMEPCDKCTHSYSYQFSEWLPCTTISGSYLNDVKSHPLIGYQTRDIACLQNKGVLASLRHCADKLPHTLLTKYKGCVMPQDCRVSDWSSIRPHNASCIGYDGQIVIGYWIMTRTVEQLPMGDGKPCPPDLVKYVPMSKDEDDIHSLRPCRKAKWIMSSWSTCMSVPGYNHCGTGMQSRMAICVEAGDDGVERPVEESLCPQPKPLVAQSCTMECNWDCSVSQWSAWSTCQSSDCDRQGLRRKRVESQYGQRFRTREILTLPGPGGTPCPHLSEARICDPAPCYSWNVTFGPCEPTTRGGCGDGTQTKKSVCVNRSGVKVRERFCYATQSSEDKWVECYVPCPEDCVLSDWGSWSACPAPCGMQIGARTLRNRKRQILAYHGRNGRPCPPIQSLHESEPCPVLRDCEVYQWETSVWGACTLDSYTPGSPCGMGTQTRTVSCRTAQGVPSVDERCVQRIKPKNSQSCVVECPVDCHVTEWSEWSTCGVTCLPVLARQIYPAQVRRRYVLQYPQNGGLSCPSDMREEQSCIDLPVCQNYYWETTDWSDCILPPVVPLCGQGLRARNVTCIHSDDQRTSQVSINVCLENLGTMPDITDHCYRPCRSECQLSQWSPWTQCGPRCEKTRFRFRRLIGPSKDNPDCRNTDLYPRDQHEECVCNERKPILVGGWSDCIIQSGDGGDRFAPKMSLKSIGGRHRRNNETGLGGFEPYSDCGVGKKYMALSCKSHDLYTPNGPRCAGEEYLKENCSIACPVDCAMSDWSAWTACSSRCGSGVQQRDRRIERHPANGGRKCPLMYGQSKETQARVCHVDCSYYVWRVEDWGPCLPSGGQPCGDGSHSRTIRCVSVGSDSSEMTVDESYCPRTDQPVPTKACSLPCPGDCVMSEWSEWTLCRQPCNGQQTQTRHRQVLRRPAQYASSLACDTKTEERSCERMKNCIEYSWELSDWTSCLVNGGGAECGVGHKERYAICGNERGEKVESYKCEELFGPVTEPLVVSCEIPCDNDCLVSTWSDWSLCSTSCGLGYTKRRRTVVQTPIGNGRKCPEKLEQTKPCFYRGCYTWRVSEWSVCMSQKGVCGSGVQDRNVSCIDDDGRAVNSSKCPLDLEKLVMQTVRPCRVPCPGECKLSEWSEWSDCFVSCEDFEQGFTQGFRARSRAILTRPAPGNAACNGTLWEDQQCTTRTCTWFTWKTGEWDYFHLQRNVWCEQNNGLHVVGGCDETKKPQVELRCFDPVCVEPAQCRDSNTCKCPDEKYLLDIEKESNRTVALCKMNNTIAEGNLEDEKTEMAKSPNIWMYAVITVGTLFVIAVTAALYNMCELFRTGPRPRRKGDTASTTGTIHSVNALPPGTTGTSGEWASGNGGIAGSESLYKQINHSNHRLESGGGSAGGGGSSVEIGVPGGGGGGGGGGGSGEASDNEYAETAMMTSPVYQNSQLPRAMAKTTTTTTPGRGGRSSDAAAALAAAAEADIPDIDAITFAATTATASTTPSTANTNTTALSGGSFTPGGNIPHGVNGNGGVGGASSKVGHGYNNRSDYGDIDSSQLHAASLKHNRRYKKSHSLFPARLAKLFSCTDKSSECMVEDMHSTDHDKASTQCQAMSLTRAHAIENMEMCGGEFYTNTASGFQTHHCMLPKSHDLRPNKLDLQQRRNNYYSESDNIDNAEKRISIPLADEIEREMARMSPMAAQTFTSQNSRDECRSSTESLALSSDLISGRHEGSSQCSLQLGDTAETLTQHDSPSRMDLLMQLQQQQQLRPSSRHIDDSHAHQPRGAPALASSSEVTLASSITKPESSSSAVPGRSAHRLHPVTTNRGSNVATNNKISSNAEVHYDPNLYAIPHSPTNHPQSSSGSLQEQGKTTRGGLGVPAAADQPPFYPLHVQVPPLPVHSVDALLYDEDNRGGNPHHPYHQHHHHHHHPPPPPPPYSRSKSGIVSSSHSPSSFPTDSPRMSRGQPHHYQQHPQQQQQNSQHLHHQDKRGARGREGERAHGKDPSGKRHAPRGGGAISPGGLRTMDSHFPSSPGSRPPAISSSRSSASLPDHLIHSSSPRGGGNATRPNPLLMEKVSQDSGHSTMPLSQSLSPGETSLDKMFLKRSGSGFSPVRVQVSEESGHDSPTPSLCNSCRKELDKVGVNIPYLAGTPDSSSQMSNISGMETSV